jgi:hypothetical protein
MHRILAAVALTLTIMFVVPLPIYGTLAAFTGLEIPTTGSPLQFMVSVVVIKTGVSVAFVLLFLLARPGWTTRWATYALVWWVMFALIETGQAITPDYSWLAAIGGIISEAVYFPLSAFVIARILEPRRERSSGG